MCGHRIGCRGGSAANRRHSTSRKETCSCAWVTNMHNRPYLEESAAPDYSRLAMDGLHCECRCTWRSMASPTSLTSSGTSSRGSCLPALTACCMSSSGEGGQSSYYMRARCIQMRIRCGSQFSSGKIGVHALGVSVPCMQVKTQCMQTSRYRCRSSDRELADSDEHAHEDCMGS